MIRNGVRATVLALGVMTIAVACSDDEEEKKKEAERQVAAAIDAFTQTYCEIVVTCCNRILELPRDVPACKKRIAELDPIMVKDEKARTDCLAQLRANTPNAGFCAEFGNVEQSSCPDPRRKPLTGTKKVGEECAAEADCEPSYEGVVTCAGVCRLTKRGKEGDGPCTTTIDGDVVHVLGEPEGSNEFLCFTRDGLLCDPKARKCAKPLALEKPCEDTRQCAVGTFCEEREKLCFTRVKTGKLCTQIDECEGYCKDEECVDLVAEGGTCDDKNPCAQGLACTDGKCAQPPADARLAASCVD